MKIRNNYIVAGIGELLWDVFPEGKRLGGAPVNFSYHCRQQDATGYPVSAVGSDALGAEIREELVGKCLPDEFVALDATYPTGTVQVTLDDKGAPEYEICEGVAWDYIPKNSELDTLAQKTDAVSFGSLAQRHKLSRATIHAFLGAMCPETLKIFDVNLRQTSLLNNNQENTAFQELTVILMVCGSKDPAVPYEENDAIMEQRYKALGGSIEVIVENKGHSHGMKDPTPVIEFIKKNTNIGE